MPGVGGLETRGPRLQFALLLGVRAVGGLQVVQLGHQFVLRELQRIHERAISGNSRR